MQKRLKLAVVIPNFNYARFLPTTIDSVLQQEPPFDEIVVVDDGSTDQSIEVLSKYGNRIKVVRITNRGQLGACWAGIQATTSEYIYTLDADDFAAPGCARRLRQVIGSLPAKIQFQLASVNSQGVSLSSNFPIYPRAYDAETMRRHDSMRGNHICPPTSGNVFSRAALERLPISTYDSRGTIDGSPMFAMPYLGEVISLNEVLAAYRIHTGGMSVASKPTVAILLREIKFFKKCWNEVTPSLRLNTIEFNRNEALFVAERRLMIDGLEGKLLMADSVVRYVAGLARSGIPARQRLVLVAWAIALLFPSKRLKSYLVQMRRSSANRSAPVQALITIFTGGWRRKGL